MSEVGLVVGARFCSAAGCGARLGLAGLDRTGRVGPVLGGAGRGGAAARKARVAVQGGGGRSAAQLAVGEWA